MRHERVMQALSVPGVSSGARNVLALMADRARDGECLYFESREKLARKARQHPKTIQKQLRELQRLGYVSEVAPAREGRNRTLKLHPDQWPSPP